MSSRRSTASAPDVADIRRFALSLLAHRDYSVRELIDRLGRKWRSSGSTTQHIEVCVAALIDEGLLSDLRFAEGFIRSRMLRHSGPLRIRSELRQRGVAPDVIEQSVDAEGIDWVELAFDWLSRRAGRYGPRELTFEDRAAWHRRLMSRGFSHDVADTALTRFESVA